MTTDDEVRAAIKQALADPGKVVARERDDQVESVVSWQLHAVMAVVTPLVGQRDQARAELDQLRAAESKFVERLSDLQAEYAKHYGSWERQRARLVAERDRLAGRRASAIPDDWRTQVWDAIDGTETVGAADTAVAKLVTSWRGVATQPAAQLSPTSNGPQTGEPASRTLHVTTMRDVPDGHTDQRVRWAFEGSTWDGWLIGTATVDGVDEAYVLCDEDGKPWVVIAENLTPIDTEQQGGVLIDESEGIA